MGPLEPLLRDRAVSDILVTTPRLIYIERGGNLERTNVEFKDDAHLMRIIERVVSRVGRRIDESSPMVDARLPDGSRVNAVIPPLAVDGPLLSIRRFGIDPLQPADLLRNVSITEGMLELVKAAQSLDAANDALIQAAKEHGGDDNITCVLMRVVELPWYKRWFGGGHADKRQNSM